MIESFDRDLELAIDKKMVEKQHKLVVDSLKRSGVEVKLKPHINEITNDYLQGVIDMIEVSNRFDKMITQEIAEACIKIGNLGYRLSDEDYERLEKRLKEINKYKEIQPRDK